MLNSSTSRNRGFRASVRYIVTRFAPLLIVVSVLSAQPAARTVLQGHIHPLARAENDRGRVSPALQLSYVTLTLAQSASQQAGLNQLLAEQQTPGSPNYHRWITPEEYAQRFGASQEEVNRVVTWLQGQGLDIAAIARGRGWIAVNGAAAQIESAFQTELHQYLVNGETHFANATAPSVPASLGGIVRTIRGLHDFRLKPGKHTLRPAYTSRGTHYLAPDDFATIYDVMPLYAAGLNGSGQKVVVAGQTDIVLSDITTFRKSYNLPVNNPQLLLVPNSADPGITPCPSACDLEEADLDLEWTGAVARNATIIYVYSTDIMVSEQYAIDQNLAPVMSASYGACELETLSADALSLESFAKQGNAQGMTWINSAGDAGGADCYDPEAAPGVNPGLSVDMPASVPEVTGLGGTEFVEGNGQYWNTANNANQASALSYIPETVWNDSTPYTGDGSGPAAGGGGVSIYFAKPSWQTGPGVPSDNARHVPDLALSASPNHDGYLVFTGGSLQIYGGTSCAAPSFAGVAVLLNQYLVSSGAQRAAGLGNMNVGLYSEAQSAPTAFHDITTGNNIVTVTCPSRSPGCSSGSFGYVATVGYDNASGLGSVDAYNLVMGWNGAAITPPPNTGLTLVSNLTSLSTNETIFLTATVTGSNGTTPTGVVEFEAGNASLGSPALVGSAGIATATLVLSGTQLPIGSVVITATYSGSTNATASVTLSITPAAGSPGTPLIAAFQNSASFAQEAYAPGMLVTVWGSNLAPSPSVTNSVPFPVTMAGVAATVNGEAAPLYYVSPDQFNIQIPYETAIGTATLEIDNNGQVGSQTFSVAAASPGIYTQNGSVVTGYAPEGTATRGQITTLYITGGGAVTPGVATGAAPAAGTAVANLPQPSQQTTMTVGGVSAPIQFIGIPTWAVGVIQINFQVPTGIGVGMQPVVVTVGSVPSAAAMIDITN
jgi:uncharacterized protein (TIGR03437 family)